MNMKSLLSLGFLCVVALMSAHNEDFSGKSLEELKAIYAASLQNSAGTPEYKKMQKIEQKRAAVYESTIRAELRCALHKYDGWTTYIPAWIEGVTENDCDLAKQYGKELRKLNDLCTYGNQQVIIANPELQVLIDCMNEKAYEAIDISEETI